MRIKIVFIFTALTVLISQELFSQNVNGSTEHLKDIVEKRESFQYGEMANKSIDEGDFKMALEYFDKAINLYPSAGFYIKRGRLKAELEDLGGAIQDFTLAIDFSPYYDHSKESLAYQFAVQSDMEAYFYRGRLYLRKNRLSLAIKDFTKSIDLYPTSEAYRLRGHTNILAKSHLEAISDYSKAMELDPGNPVDLFYRGLSYFAISKFEETCNDFNELSVYSLGEENDAIVSGIMHEFCR